MSQRHFIRRIAMELSTRSGFQGDGATLQTSVAATEEVDVQAGMDAPPFSVSGSKNNHQWQLQNMGGREQDPLLHNSSNMKNRGFTPLDVVRETVQLTRARGTYFLGFLALFTLVYLLTHVFEDFLVYRNRPDDIMYRLDESVKACEMNILRPWLEAATSGNSSSTEQQKFYTLFQRNCSMFQDPATGVGNFRFFNGTVTWSTASFMPALEQMMKPFVYNTFVVGCFADIWCVWAQVAVTWGLHVATRITMSYHSRPSHHDPMHIPSQKLSEVFREQFNPTVLLGTIRAVLTYLLITTQDVIAEYIAEYIITTLRPLVENRSALLPFLAGISAVPKHLWKLTDPIPFLFLLSIAAAALEPGMWGFRALRRGIRLAQGNWLTTYSIYLVIFLWGWLISYFISVMVLEPEKVVNQSVLEMLGRSVGIGILNITGFLPDLFLLPVLYFLCKSWRERVATMA